MKKTIITFALVLTSLLSQAQKLFTETNVSGDYEKGKRYKIAIMPVILKLQVEDQTAFKAKTQSMVSNKFMAIKNFSLVSKNAIDEAGNAVAFGGGELTTADNKKVAEAVGADLYMVVTLYKEKVGKKFELTYADIAIYRTIDDVQLVAAKARGKAPLLPEAEAELAIDLIVEDLKGKL